MIKKYALIFLVFGFQMAWTQNNVNNKIDSLKSLLAKTNIDTTKVNLNNSLSIIYLTVNTSAKFRTGFKFFPKPTSKGRYFDQLRFNLY